MRVNFLGVLTVLAVFAPALAHTQEIIESHPGTAVEPMYAEAVLAFNSKNPGEALRVLNKILKVSPGHIPSLELKALTLRSSGKESESTEAYQKLIELKPGKDSAPYHYEIGMIHYHGKKFPEAQTHLQESIKHGFNLDSANFFLGLITLQNENLSGAEHHFSEVISQTRTEDLKIAAHFYLGMIYFRTGYGSGATHQMIEARDRAASQKDSQIAKDVGAAASKTLAPYDSAQWFNNATVMGQYDGNVSMIPIGSTSIFDVSGNKATAKAVTMLGAGRMSSPLKTFQWVGNVRLSYNRNFNSDTRNYEFFSVLPSFYLTYKPLARTPWGIKLESNITLQNSLEDLSGVKQFPTSPFSYTVDTGPFVRRELIRHLQVTAETSIRYQKFVNLSSETGAARRTGLVVTPRLSARYDSSIRILNPSIYSGYEFNQADGVDYQSRTLTLGISDLMRITAKNLLTLGLDLAYATFPYRTDGVRSDLSYTARASYIRVITAKISGMADMSFTQNNSNLANLYSYVKPVFSMGVSLSI